MALLTKNSDLVPIKKYRTVHKLNAQERRVLVKEVPVRLWIKIHWMHSTLIGGCQSVDEFYFIEVVAISKKLRTQDSPH